MAEPKVVTVDVAKLTLPQLTQLKQQLDNEVDLFGASLQQLKIAQTKFQESSECVQKLSFGSQAKPTLVPLSESMYVPGEITNVDKVLIDIGTGYYVDLSIPAAKDYFKRKIKFVTAQMEKIQPIAKEKLILRDIVIETIESKFQAALSSQQVASASKS